MGHFLIACLCDCVCCMSVTIWMYLILCDCVCCECDCTNVCDIVWLCVCVPFWTAKWWNTTQTAGPSPLGLLPSVFPTVPIPPRGLVSATPLLHGQWETLSGHWPLEHWRENCSCGTGSSEDVCIHPYLPCPHSGSSEQGHCGLTSSILTL